MDIERARRAEITDKATGLAVCARQADQPVGIVGGGRIGAQVGLEFLGRIESEGTRRIGRHDADVIAFDSDFLHRVAQAGGAGAQGRAADLECVEVAATRDGQAFGCCEHPFVERVGRGVGAQDGECHAAAGRRDDAQVFENDRDAIGIAANVVGL